MNTPNRLMNLRIPQRAILEMFLLNAKSIREWRHISVPVFPTLPETTDVVSVREDFLNRCFVFTLYNPTFPPLQDGEVIPFLGHDTPIVWESIPLTVAEESGPRCGCCGGEVVKRMDDSVVVIGGFAFPPAEELEKIFAREDSPPGVATEPTAEEACRRVLVVRED